MRSSSEIIAAARLARQLQREALQFKKAKNFKYMSLKARALELLIHARRLKCQVPVE